MQQRRSKIRRLERHATLSWLLKKHKPDIPNPDALVFPAPGGGAIDGGNFADREWTNILKECDIEYLRPYYTRHTFISHCLEQGMNPVTVAQMTGHNVKTLFERYAGLIQSTPKAPRLFS